MGICFHREIYMREPGTGKPIIKSDISTAVRLESIRNKYKFVKILGYGQFGVVRKAYKIETSQNPESPKRKKFAIKSLNKDRIKRSMVMLKRELEILQTVDHPNIIKLYETYEDSKYIHMVLEYCSGGDIFDYLIKKGSIVESEVARIMQKMLSALNHLHSLKICHRDLKPENFLFMNSEPNAEVKLADFGMSVKFGEEDMLTKVGTPFYVAPEILRGIYGKECDVWSLGVVMYLLLSGRQPFLAHSMNDLFQKITRGDYSFTSSVWSMISDDAKELISRLLDINPSTRITITNALQHKWFSILYQTPQERMVGLEIFNSLKKFRAPSKLWQEAMKVLVRNLSEEELHELQGAFKLIDRSNTGFITVEDIAVAMKGNGFSILGGEFTKLMQNIDYIGKGKLNYTQFLIAAMDRKRLIDEEGMWAVFQHFDINNDGRICVDELKFALEKAGCYISQEDFEEIIKEFQLKVGDFMSFDEFKQIMMCFSNENSEVGTELDEDEKERKGTKRLSQRRLTNRRRTAFDDASPTSPRNLKDRIRRITDIH